MTDSTTEATIAPETTVSKSKAVVTPRKANKYADALLAKKKKRRAAHRATIKRANANG
jgi:hypothetical protein